VDEAVAINMVESKEFVDVLAATFAGASIRCYSSFAEFEPVASL
jgi:hypothetical protein